jgi:hypothetical protein
MTVCTITTDDLWGLSSPGYCRRCCELTTEGCEPDAREYVCDECGRAEVYGLEHALMAWPERFDIDDGGGA